MCRYLNNCPAKSDNKDVTFNTYLVSRLISCIDAKEGQRYLAGHQHSVQPLKECRLDKLLPIGKLIGNYGMSENESILNDVMAYFSISDPYPIAPYEMNISTSRYPNNISYIAKLCDFKKSEYPLKYHILIGNNLYYDFIKFK